MKKLLAAIVILVLLYLLFYPIDVQPEKWTPPKAPELTGIYQQNEMLSSIERNFEGVCLQCEDVAVDSNGFIYGGTEEGAIMKLKPGEQPVVLTETHGRPLGLHLDKENNLIVGDAQKGLLSIDPTGNIEVLVTEHGGMPFLFTDDVDIAADGKIYFSDASHKFNNLDYKLDFIEHGPNGRLLVYNPADGSTELLMDGLYFANGVALSEDDSFVVVNETSDHRVMRYWLKGDHAGKSDIFLDNLPFYPDGISYNEDGIFWVAMMSPRNSLLEGLSKQPFLRKVIARVPPALMPRPQNYSFILGVDRNGKVVYNLQDPKGRFAQITSIQQFGNKLYLGSLMEPAIGIFDLDKLK
ncbi:MAG: strictosidine synthase family protein [Bacteroidetes bacterium]|nr:strictosidine synthase family protein [Bacteroidota bacterium]